MHITVISDFEAQSGGAAICATRLVNSLLACGQQVTRIVSYPDGKKHRWNTAALAPSFLAWSALSRLPRNIAELFSGWEHERRLGGLLKSIKPDVINVHNFHGALNNGWKLDLLQICQEYAPVVWTLHDMWSITGRCAFSYDCEKFISGCDDSCPTPQEYPALQPDKIRGAWQQRSAFFNNSQRLSAVTPSTWLANAANKGFWSGRRIEVIPYGLPLDVYSPVDKSIARQALGLDLQSPVLLFAGVSLEERRKGMQVAVEAIRKVNHRPLSIITFGADPPRIDLSGVVIHHLGYIDHERTKALVYNSADIFIHPSLADNLPNTIIEAIACGTPVMAFAVGGVPELVKPGKTGWLVSETSADCLAHSIDSALAELDAPDRHEFITCEIAEGQYSDDLQAQRYLALFESLI